MTMRDFKHCALSFYLYGSTLRLNVVSKQLRNNEHVFAFSFQHFKVKSATRQGEQSTREMDSLFSIRFSLETFCIFLGYNAV